MVICAIVGCSNRSDTRSADGSRLSFYGIPTVTDRYGKAELELRKKRRDGFLAAISREDIDMTALHKYKVCEMHFHSRKPAYLYNEDRYHMHVYSILHFFNSPVMVY